MMRNTSMSRKHAMMRKPGISRSTKPEGIRGHDGVVGGKRTECYSVSALLFHLPCDFLGQ